MVNLCEAVTFNSFENFSPGNICMMMEITTKFSHEWSSKSEKKGCHGAARERKASSKLNFATSMAL